MKFYWGEGIGFSPEENQEFTEIFRQRDFDEKSAFEVGSVSEVDPYPEFVKYLKSKFSFDRKFKVALDAGNGATSLVVPQLFEELG